MLLRRLLPLFFITLPFAGCFSTQLAPLVRSEPPILSDDSSPLSLEAGLADTIHYLEKSPEREMKFGDLIISRGNYAAALKRLLQNWKSAGSAQEKLDYVKEHFIFFKSSGTTGAGKILLTGYFEPVLQGSRLPEGRFHQPLYRKPASLLDLPLKLFSPRFAEESTLKARTDNGQIVPYFTRAEIDGPQKALSHQNLEIAYVDPIDAFFLHIQGSGTVRLTDDSEIFLNYADKNGQKYEAIGKIIKERTGSQSVTMQTITSYLRSIDDTERDRILFENPSYVFFKESLQRAVTATNIPAVPQRSIATDPTVFPKGALAFLNFTNPINQRTTARFVLDHDTGGAIKGAGRVDLFCGRGDGAKQFAGPLQDKNAEIFYLVPK